MSKALLPGALAALIAFPLALPAAAQPHQCPDYVTPYSAPELKKPAKKGFRNLGNTLLALLNPPFHMVHDEIVREGQPITLVGKFDYSAVLHKDLEFEDVHVYLYGTGMSNWQYLGKHRTDSDGKVYVQIPPKPEGDYRVRMIVEGDLTEAEGFLTVVKPGRKTVLFDIDGTITLNDFEFVGDYLGTGTAATHGYAVDMVWEYINKGYQVVYLTGRQYWMAKATRDWFHKKGLFSWHLRTDSNAENPVAPQTQAYKTAYIRHLKQNVGLNIVRAYGNAETDIWAYAAGGIPKADTFIIGEHAGKEGTQPIHGDYGYHFSTVVATTPDSGCTWR